MDFLENLEHLIISQNKLFYLDESVSDLISLRKLIVNNNKILTIPFTFNNEWMSHLDLSNNQIERISDGSLNNLISLEVLNLSHNRLEEIKGFPESEKMRELDISYNLLCL